MILMDEFNLAAPEYYFSQLLQSADPAAGAGEARCVFTMPGPHAGNGDERPIDQLRINPNVSFWGTINYDETTERLSPGLLDRTGMIFLSVRDVVPPSAAWHASASDGQGGAGGTIHRPLRARPGPLPGSALGS